MFSPATKQISDNPRPSKRSRRNDDGVASLTSANAAPLGGSNNNSAGNNPQKKNKGDRFADFLAVMNPAKSVQAESSSMNTDVQALLAPEGATVGSTKESKPTKKKTKGGDDAAAAEPTPESDGAAQDEELTDAEYLARRMKRKLSEVDDDEDGVLQEEADDGVAAADAPEFEQDAEDGGKVRSIRGVKLSPSIIASVD